MVQDSVEAGRSQEEIPHPFSPPTCSLLREPSIGRALCKPKKQESPGSIFAFIGHRAGQRKVENEWVNRE